ncbi:MAG: VWA domain-containing protein [Planctomycetota bacterium]
MTFATPAIAALAAAVAVPTLLILYFLKLRRRDVEVSSTLLWTRAVQDMQANAPFQRLRKNLLLFLQLLALLLGLAALAQPEIASEALVGDRHTILIDRSASMAAMDGEVDGEQVSRLDQAKAEAIELVESLDRPDWWERAIGGSRAVADRATVIAFGASGEIVQAMTDDASLLRAAIESIETEDTPTRAAQAYRLAAAQAPKQTRIDRDGRSIDLPPVVGRVHLWSDGRLADAADVAPGPEDSVRYRVVGSEDAANVGITGLRVERDYDEPASLSVFVGLSSTHTLPVTVGVEFLINGDLVGVRDVELTPAEGEALGAGGVVFDLERRDGAVASIRLVHQTTTSDLLTVDDRGWLVIPPTRRQRVALVSEDDFFTRLALEGLPLASLTPLTPASYTAARAAGGDALYDIVVFDGWLPGEDALPPGSILVLGATPSAFGLSVEPSSASDELIDWSPTHPVTRDLELTGRVTLADAPRVTVGDGSAVEVLAEAGVGPMIFDAAAGATRAIVVAFDPDRSSWPFDVSYVVFLASALEVLGDGGSEAAGRTVQPGSTYTDRLPIGARSVRMIIDNTPDVDLTPADDGRVSFGPIRRSGVYRLEWSGPSAAGDLEEGGRVRRPIVANLVDANETDLRVVRTLSFASGVVEGDAGGAVDAPLRLWRWLLLAVLAILLIEWWVYNRRVVL